MKSSLWSRFAHFHLTSGHILRAALIIGAYLLVCDLLSTFAIYPFTDRIYTGTFKNTDRYSFEPCGETWLANLFPAQKRLLNFDTGYPYDTTERDVLFHIRFIGRTMHTTDLSDAVNPRPLTFYVIHQALDVSVFNPSMSWLLQLLPTTASLLTGLLVFILARQRSMSGHDPEGRPRQIKWAILAAILAAITAGLDVALLFNILNPGCG